MKVLIACEYSGRVREAFRDKGHDAWSCDLLPAEDNSYYHIQSDVLEHINDGWDLIIAHPPCTYLTIAAEWLYKDNIDKKLKPGTLFGEARREARREAAQFVWRIWNAECERVCIENPVGAINRLLPGMPKPQYIQPYQFGDDASKRTGLWIRGMKAIVIPPENEWCPPRLVEHGGKTVERWSNQTDGGWNKLAPSDDRWKERSRTYPGIAKAFAENWS